MERGTSWMLSSRRVAVTMIVLLERAASALGETSSMTSSPATSGPVDGCAMPFASCAYVGMACAVKASAEAVAK